MLNLRKLVRNEFMIALIYTLITDNFGYYCFNIGNTCALSYAKNNRKLQFIDGNPNEKYCTIQ